jgi:hypothetical protein
MLSYKEPIDGVITPLGWYKSTVSIQSLIDNQLPKGRLLKFFQSIRFEDFYSMINFSVWFPLKVVTLNK